MTGQGYLVKLQNEDRYWSSDAREFVYLNDIIKPTIMSLDEAKKFALDFGIESKSVYKICNTKGVILKSYSENIEKQVLKYLGY